MRTRTKLLFVGFTAALVFSMTVASASATRLSISNRNFRATFTPLTLGSTAGVRISCPVTLEGSFHSATINKTLEALIGHVTRASVTTASCTGGRATIAQSSLPWHIRYGGFTGTLPRLSGVILRLVGATFTVEDTETGATCTTRTTATQPGVGIVTVEANGLVTGLRADESRFIPLSGEFLCFFAGEGFFSGNARVTLLGSTANIRVTLI
jgi:hypothetical protein